MHCYFGGKNVCMKYKIDQCDYHYHYDLTLHIHSSVFNHFKFVIALKQIQSIAKPLTQNEPGIQ